MYTIKYLLDLFAQTGLFKAEPFAGEFNGRKWPKNSAFKSNSGSPD
jgi:hypothetical protein